MTARRYAVWLLAAFLAPGAVIYGGLLIVTSSDRLSTWFTDQLFKALREDVS
jgi:hypothetical protein